MKCYVCCSVTQSLLGQDGANREAQQSLTETPAQGQDEPEATVDDVKVLVFGETGIPSSQQRLVVAGKQLGPGDSIDTTKVPGKVGVTLELCAGIIDKV